MAPGRRRPARLGSRTTHPDELRTAIVEENRYDSLAMLAVLITLALALVYDARETVPGSTQGSAAEIGSRLIQDPAVTTAIDRIKGGEPLVLDDQIRLCEIPAPPFKETRRAE